MQWLKKILFKKKPKILVICGPTATGKTSLSISIAKKFRGEIISADSRQVYRGLDIGSAKITKEEMQNIPHHMIDIASPHDVFTVQEFTHHATKIIKEIISRGNTPIICGGTGQYIDALVFNQSFPKVPPNRNLRAILETRSTQDLYKELMLKDPHRAKNIDQHNKVRLVRALEIVDALGVVPRQKTSSPYQTLFIGLDVDKESHAEIIRERIIDRFDNQSMLQEAKDLYNTGVSYERMESLGLEYRYMAQHLQNKISYPKMIEELTVKTIQFAKRQRTWFKRNKNIIWYNLAVDQEKDIYNSIKKFLS